MLLRPFIGAFSIKWIVNRMHFSTVKISDYLLDRTVKAEEVLNRLTPEDAERLEFCMTEYRNMLEQGADVPKSLSKKNVLDLLCCTSFTSRANFLKFLFKNEKRIENHHRKKAEKVSVVFERKPASCDRILRMIDEKCVRLHWDFWQASEIRCPDSAQPLLFDFSFESEMRLVDLKSLSNQMTYVLNRNRVMRPHPFNMVLCGLKQGTNQYAFLEDALGVNMEGSSIKSLNDLPWTITPNHFSDEYSVHDPEQPVILLSPNSRHTFEAGEYDHNAAYVIGAVVDRAVRRPISSAIARQLGIKCVSLPLDRYLKWGSGRRKTLTINCIHAIMAAAKETNGDWKRALIENIPTRFYSCPSRSKKSIIYKNA
ncbi:tRNA methyltransferase 10 [Schistosoma japonicum]|uniref:RNA (guanine-9-)-methyltransferase domain-containing protein 1 n=1 Tax=Schistosoma japonicum TaxID=6182 RepID=C1LEP3_SCHJA|nr:Mitochondrial ribonuclease P protein 1 like [Schistosoma japonicum]KAH8864630.1 Mitochondrial ribonuclease P protein 1 like [Schistosoma japonicum]TNN19073.1 tRNA methyltransferase 10 [Schistosoma japonicum]CAX73171.1 RNA (guanine-9-) methyltransferase domain containing protein [Schistosoma japonicum]